ncbi:MAG: hypothetical protein LDL19_05055 [Thiobacillus sp.]|nr:hypothetical protein [Thiobacillus sp.]
MRILVLVPLLFALAACGASSPQPAAPVKKASPAGPPPPSLPADDLLVCPADVQACPNGSFVSRNPAKGCTFDACPVDKK